MLSTSSRSLLSALVLMAVAICARASLVPNLDIPDLVERCDLVAVGRVIELAQIGSTNADDGVSARLMQASLEIDKLLKGRPGSRDLRFTFVLPDAPIGYAGIGKGEYAVFFLDSSSVGYHVHDPYHPCVVASPGQPKSGGTLIDQVVAELAHAAASSPESSQLLAVRALRTLRDPGATAALRVAAGSRDEAVRCAAVAALLARGAVDVLPAGVNLLLHPDPNTDPSFLENIAYGIREGIKDPETVAIIEPLVRDPHIIYRLAAVTALRNTHDSRAIGALSEALWDSDQRVLYQAVAGLGEITGQDEWTPSIEYFNQNKSRFLEHWRDWIRTQKH